MQNWYALHSKPHKEAQVRESLAARGVEVFLPALTRPRKRGEGVVERPYFPCYLFCRVDLAAVGVSAVQYTPGLRRIVAFNEGEPTPVRPEVIELIRQRLARLDTFDGRGQPLRPGDRVEILSGVLKGYEALFDRRLTPQGRVRLLVHLLSREVPMEATLDMIRRL